jgi:hypothetical protein
MGGENNINQLVNLQGENKYQYENPPRMDT